MPSFTPRDDGPSKVPTTSGGTGRDFVGRRMAGFASSRAVIRANLITIDGGAHTGKSTAARRLAEWLGWDWVSTGAFYRGLARVAAAMGVDPADEPGLVHLVESGEFGVELSPDHTIFRFRGRDITAEIFTAKVGEITPLISRLPNVRASLLEAQRRLVDGRIGLVAEGRDCGTMVFPNAPLKIFFTVNDEAAAERFARGHDEPYELALSHIRERNERDRQRSTARLEPAPDAVIFDTSPVNPEAVLDWLKALCREHGWGPPVGRPS